MCTERVSAVDWDREIAFGRPLEHLPLLAQMAGVEVPEEIKAKIMSARNGVSITTTPGSETD